MNELGMRDRRSNIALITFELTERCNFNCIHCCVRQDDCAKLRKSELRYDEINDIVDQAADMGCLYIRFTGGEPLFRHDFALIYEHARRKGMRVNIATNGALINSRIAKMFASFASFEDIYLSIYGLDNAAYEKTTRTAGSYRRVYDAMALLRAFNVPYKLKGIFPNRTAKELISYKRIIRTNKYLKDHISGYNLYLDPRYRRDSPEKNAKIMSYRTKVESVFDNNNILIDDYAKHCMTFIMGHAGRCGPNIFTCSAGRGQICVDSYGYLYPCLMLKSEGLSYDIRRGRLYTAISEFFPRKLNLISRNAEYIEKCSECFLKPFCEQCPGKSFVESGVYDQPLDYYCHVTNEIAQRIGLLKHSEQSWQISDWHARIRKYQMEGRVL